MLSLMLVVCDSVCLVITDENGNTSPWTKAQLYLALGNTLSQTTNINDNINKQ
jgi:hypothetical protein